uniref:Estrogen receptor n=1 Tax=Eisenia fetida TaxID=6396 RepID=A0A4D6WJ38_EISFE|nr:estrogen receptor [Eisenia fetida]
MRLRETDSVVELPPRRQKNAIDKLRAHLERRQEGRPSSSTAYASLHKHLADIEETGNRYEAVHGTMFGELQEAKTTRSKTSFLSETEADVRGPSYSNFHSEKVTLIGNPEEPGQQKRCLSELSIRGSQRKQHHERLNDTDVSNHASEVTPITRAGRPYRPEAEPEPDSPSSHSLPDVSRISNPAVTNHSQSSRRPASIGTGFPSSEYLTKTDVAPVMMDTGSNGGGRALESCSPDQSTNYMNYSAENLPAIIATARLDDDCEFTSSFADTLKETITARDHHHPIDKSPNGSLRNRKSVVRSGSVGTGLSSSPEPPSSTFEDELVTDRKQDEDNAKPAESAIPCKICQDVANGFHYGVWSCEGCKAFFKRSITGSAKYVCPADNNCTINRLRKKSCQACRLRKCYEYGMSPGNCRGENGSKMRKRKLLEANRKEDMRNTVNGDDGRMNVASNQSLSCNVFLPAPAVLHNFHNQSTVAEPASGPVNILQHLLAVERPIRFADFVDVRTAMDAAESERIQLLTSITKLVSLQLMDVVTWSRSLPGFRNVNLNIRTHLLASSWSEILLLTNAFYSLQCTNAIAIAPNLHLTKERCEVIGMVALYNRLMAIVKSFQQLALTHNEMLLMQALLLVNADVTAPQLIPRLDELRVRLMRSWHESCAGGQGQGHVDYDRIPQLLMLLPHIRHCSLLFQRFLADFKRDSRIPFNGFLQEVTDGRYECDRVSVLELLIEEEAGLQGMHGQPINVSS